MKKLVLGLAIYFAMFAVSAIVGNAQDVDDGLETETAVTYNSGWYYPTANSRTAMRRCGITEEVIHRMGYTVAVRLSEPLIVDAVEYCINSAQKLSGWTSNLKGRKGQKIVMAPGTLVWADPKDSEYAYAGGCLNKIKAKVTIPAKVAPNPTPTPASTTVPPPMCANRNLTIAQARENDFLIEGNMCNKEQPKPPKPVESKTITCEKGELLNTQTMKCEQPRKKGTNWVKWGLIGGAIAAAAIVTYVVLDDDCDTPSGTTPRKVQTVSNIPITPGRRNPGRVILGYDQITGKLLYDSRADSGTSDRASPVTESKPVAFTCPANYTPLILKGERICSPN